MTALTRRVFAEKRLIIVALAIGLIANVLAYVLVVRPLRLKSEGAADRATAAANAVRAAEKDLTLARSLVTGKQLADQELGAFYEKVLPADLTAARRMTYASLYALTRKANVRYEARATTVEPLEKDARLARLTMRMVLQGDYKNLCQFIYEVESAQEFVIIDDVTLAESNANEPLTMTVHLSTYFRKDAHAS